ncbi:MAG TPA: amino acid permease [Nitrososphaerales archaeon]|nr:amino acid permease [Nitrososphaerales archaeon]
MRKIAFNQSKRGNSRRDGGILPQAGIKQEPKSGFEPVLGFLSATGISIGGIIGSGIFFVIGIATGEAGPAVLLSLCLAGVVAILTSLSFASLGSRIVREGGEYQFVYLMLGRTVGFFGGLLWVFSTAIAAVTVSIAFVSYLNVVLPIPSVSVFAALSCLSFMLIDLFGIRLSSKINGALVILKVGVILFFIVVGLPFVNLEHFQPFLTKGVGGTLSATFLIFFAYAGFGKIAAASEEVRNARKNVPRAIIVAVVVCTILYVLSGFVAVGVAGANRLSSTQYMAAPFSYVMLSTGIGPAFFIVTAGAIAATASVLLIQMLGLSRTLYAMSANGQLPAFLSDLHSRFRTPYKAEILMGLVMAAFALLLKTNSVVSLTSLGILSYYALINLAALRIKYDGRRISVRRVISALGLLACVGLILYYFLGSVQFGSA